MEKDIAELKQKANWLALGVALSVLLNLAKIALHLFLPAGIHVPAAPALPLTPPASQNQNVTIGAAGLPNVSQRTFFTTEEVAELEGLSPRTILTYLNTGRLSPATKTERAWQIAKEYTINP